MEEEKSILISIKKLLGIEPNYTHFDPDIKIHINSAFMTLNQIGVGPSDGFSIEDETAMWTDFVPEKNVEAIKSYVYLKVRLIFDPPQSSALIAAIEKQITELEWRINVMVENKSQ